MTGLGISVGILGIIFIVAGYCMYKWKKKLKAKLSDETLCKVKYDPSAESVRILEGIDQLENLQRRILMARFDLGMDRFVEEIGVSEETMRKVYHQEDEDIDFYSLESYGMEGEDVKKSEIIYLD